MRRFLISLILLALFVPAYAATVYKWEDEKDVVNFSGDYNKVPSAFRDRVVIEEYPQEKGTPVPAQDMVAKSKEEIKTDIYGRDETWWKGKVRPWKEQLKGATENYENAQKKYMEQAEGLGQYKFGRLSLTQYQMISYRLEILNKEMETYRGQIAEANEMLSNLSKDAKETKADPAWLE